MTELKRILSLGLYQNINTFHLQYRKIYKQTTNVTLAHRAYDTEAKINFNKFFIGHLHPIPLFQYRGLLRTRANPNSVWSPKFIDF